MTFLVMPSLKILMRSTTCAEKTELEIDDSEDVYTLKVMAGSIKEEWSDVDKIRLAHKGQLLRDHDKISAAGIKDGDFVAVSVSKTAFGALPAKAANAPKAGKR